MDKNSEKLNAEVEIKQTIEGQGIDWYLQKLVRLCNANSIEFGVTLTIGGCVVSGRMIGGKKYFEEFGKEFAAAWPGDDKKEMQEAIASQGAIYERSEAKESDEPRDPPPQYIHLIDAVVFIGDRYVPRDKGVLWRGRINAVDGFSLGQLTR